MGVFLFFLTERDGQKGISAQHFGRSLCTNEVGLTFPIYQSELPRVSVAGAVSLWCELCFINCTVHCLRWAVALSLPLLSIVQLLPIVAIDSIAVVEVGLAVSIVGLALVRS